jgi:hypothetical protein
MTDMATIGDGLHRLAKLALDSGEAASIDEAMALFRSYALHIEVGADIEASPAKQAALLTAVNAARRAFLGGVTVGGLSDALCSLPYGYGRALAELVEDLGARLVPAGADTVGVELIIGRGAARGDAGLRIAADGWCASCAPMGADLDDADDAFVLAGVAAGAIGVAEAFQMLRGDNPAAGRRTIGLSLWRPDLDWRSPEAKGLAPAMLPASAWIIGLGNLGQSYLWSLAMLPFAAPGALSLTLQDFDTLAPSNDSTSLLTHLDLVGRKKSRVMADWAERQGWDTTLVERRFDTKLRVGPDDPAVALCGIDNALGRAALEDAGFLRVIEAGLGGGLSDYLALRLHSFPGPRTASTIWSATGKPAEDAARLDKPAYRALAAGGADRCGLTQLAGRTVGAPFVGALAGAFVIAELVKLANNGPSMSLIDLHLRAPGQMQAFAQSNKFACNPGVTEVSQVEARRSVLCG